MTRLLTSLAAGLLALSAATACGGETETTIFIEPDLDELAPEDDPQATLESVVQTLVLRADALDIEAEVELLEDDRVSVTASDLEPEEAHEVFTRRALLAVRQPSLDPAGQVFCRAADGSQVSVPRESISYPPADAPDRGKPRCEPGDGSFAEIVWLPATGDLVGEVTELNGDLVASASLDRTRAPIVFVKFTDAGNLLLTDISTELTGLPLGIFLDDEFLAAPTVSETIVTGNLAIAGLSLHRARIVTVQLNLGPLPVPVSEASAD